MFEWVLGVIRKVALARRSAAGRTFRCLLFLGFAVGVSVGCAGIAREIFPSVSFGGGLFVPADSDVGTGWEVEVEGQILSPGGLSLRVTGGSALIKGQNRHLSRMGGAILLPVKQWVASEKPEFVDNVILMLAVGGARAWSGNQGETAMTVGLDLWFRRIHFSPSGSWDLRVGYDWVPVDMTVAGRRISDAGGLTATILYVW